MQSRTESSVFIFLLLVFVLAVPFWVLGLVHPVEMLPGLPISALGAFTPALAALILVYRQDRLPGVWQLLQRSFDFKRVRDKRWLLLILLINPAIAVLAYALMRVRAVSLPDPTPWTLAILPMFISFFVGALGEELGWTGYATEPLQHRWGTMGASLCLGAVWAIYHFVPLTQAHRSVAWIAWWSLGTISLRMIMTWLYVHTGRSVFAAALFHAMINLCWQLFPNRGSHYDPYLFSVIAAGFAIFLFTADWFLSNAHVRIAEHHSRL